MTRIIRGIPVGRLALLGIFEMDHDKVLSPGYEELKLAQSKPKGIDGIRRVFTPDKYGRLSPEFVTLTHMSSCSILAGVVFGSIIYGKESCLQFLENNHATQFANQFEAKRQLQHRITLAMGKGGWKWGFKIGMFSTIFLLSNTIIAAYNGKCGVIEYTGAGAIAGGLYKLNLGLKGMVAGTIVGTVLGTITGVLSVIVLYCTGYSMEDVQQSQYELKKIRDEQSCQAGSKSDTKDALQILETTIMQGDELFDLELNKSSPTPNTTTNK